MKTVALVFPGQGSQTVGMAKDFYENFRESKLIFEEASDTLHINFKKLCFEGPLDELTLTENLQPALVTTEVAMLQGLRVHTDLKIGAFAGHSLGEYSAHVAAGSLGLSDAIRLTRLRGSAMQRAVPVGQGAMAAVMGLDAEALREVCNHVQMASGEVVAPANFNAPGQIVISGSATGVSSVAEALKADERYKKTRFIPLQVSAPFHCALMEPARKEMEGPLVETKFFNPSAPIIANLTAVATNDESTFANLLTKQITGAVRWQESMESLPSLGVEEIIEVGPGTVLAGLMKRINREFPAKSVNSLETLRSVFA